MAKKKINPNKQTFSSFNEQVMIVSSTLETPLFKLLARIQTRDVFCRVATAKVIRKVHDDPKNWV